MDPVRIREVLINLLVNALHHTPTNGRVTIEVSDAADHIELRVADTGPGIAADELPRIFDRFHKGAGSHGSGLGLTIARSLVEAHGGHDPGGEHRRRRHDDRVHVAAVSCSHRRARWTRTSLASAPSVCNGVTVAPRVGASDAVPARRVDQHRGGAARHAELRMRLTSWPRLEAR